MSTLEPPASPIRKPLRMAYLSAQHPMLSMIFIVREIAELERLGFDIEIASINNRDRPLDQLAKLEREQAAKTYYIKARGVAGALAAHAYALLRRPRGYLAGWRLALAMGGADLRALAMHAFYLTEALILGRWMAQRGLRHVHVHLGSQPATVGVLAKRVFDVGMSITVHGSDEFFDVWRQHLDRKVAAADFIVCISHFARSQLMVVSDYRDWSRLVVCRLGIDVSRFAPLALRRTRADEPFEMLSIGRLSPAKGHQVLLEAVALLHAKGLPIRLNLVGGGVNAAALHALIETLHLQDVVTMSGPISPDHIQEHYQRADCFVMASFAEGIPVVLMEAMSMQIPCVATHVAGIPELITHDVNGLLCPPSDAAALAAQVERLVRDPALARRLGEAGRLQVQSHYDLHANVAVLAATFAQRVTDSPDPQALRLAAPLNPAG